jgi:ATP adenylyltransferase
MRYIDDIDKIKTEGSCIFCDKPHCETDLDEFILERGLHCFVIMNIYPYNPGHVMVAPYRHVAELEALEAGETAELMELAARCTAALKRTMHPEGINLGINLGKAAGAGYDAHLHLHIVPRWVGDTNFMPVVGETKVLPETLEETYAKLKAALS